MASTTDLVLVTGASGYIATRIIQQLLEAGYRVRGTVRSLKNEKKMKPLYEAFPDMGDKLEFMEADLNDEKCWPVVVQDCTYVLHTASPIDLRAKHEEKVIRPAVEGTLSVLKASQESGTVKRVVMTSSIAAMNHCDSMMEGQTITESSWSDLEHHSIYPYAKSKILSERAAWDFVNGLKEENKIELAVVNPAVVMGPLLGPSASRSLEIAKFVLNGNMLPRLQVPVCDVRDVAAAHIKAMTVPEAAGHRHIAFICSMWTREITEVVEKEFKPQGYNVSKRVVWDFILKFASLFNGELKAIVPFLGLTQSYDNHRMRNVLGIAPYSKEDTLLEMCYDFIETGRVKKRNKYRGKISEGQGRSQLL